MLVVPATLALGLGLGFLIVTELHSTTRSPAARTTGWRRGQQHRPVYLCSQPARMEGCRRLEGKICPGMYPEQVTIVKSIDRAWVKAQGVALSRELAVAHDVAPSRNWQQGCIARIRSAGG